MTSHLDTAPKPIALWSAPRCRSTAFLRMMAERGDRTVLHEPFSLLANFGVTSVAGHTVSSEDELIDQLLGLAERTPVFFKDTTDFRYPRMLERTDFLTTVRHTVILRHPAAAIASHRRLNPHLNRDEIGFARLAEIYDRVMERGQAPVVIDSDDLVADPAGTVQAYCNAVGIPFLAQALHWPAGMREDWVGTSRWHRSTSSTTGFAANLDAPDEIVFEEAALREFLAFHMPYYCRLREHRTKPVG